MPCHAVLSTWPSVSIYNKKTRTTASVLVHRVMHVFLAMIKTYNTKTELFSCWFCIETSLMLKRNDEIVKDINGSILSLFDELPPP